MADTTRRPPDRPGYATAKAQLLATWDALEAAGGTVDRTWLQRRRGTRLIHRRLVEAHGRLRALTQPPTP